MLDFSELVKDLDNTPGYINYSQSNINYCLNGIAYNKNTDKLLITGKMWPFIYEVKLEDLD